jgi:hypothetical protein
MIDTPTRVKTPEAILSYPHLFEPWRGPNGDQNPKFSATFIFVEGTNLDELKGAVKAAGVAKWGEKKFAEMVRDGSCRLPFRTDVSGKGYPAGSTFIICRNDGPPGVVSREADPATGKPAIITAEEQVAGNPNEMYAGCMVRGLVGAFAYTNVGVGVSFGLNGVQRLGEGKRLDNRVAAQDAFDADMSDTPASIDDLI